jgi:predicted porin
MYCSLINVDSGMKNSIKLKKSSAVIVGTCIALSAMNVQASEDVKVLLEILLEKGVITQEEFDKKLKKVAEAQEIKEFNQAQDIRKANQAIEQRAERERKIKTEFYGQASLGFYQASNMTSEFKDASGMSDQPKANNRIGFKASRELDADNTAMVTLESNFSTRTGAIGRDSAGYGNANNGGSLNIGASLFDREANIRWISKEYGTFILGRGPNLQNDLSGAFDARQNWNFGGLKPIGRYAGFHSASGVNRADKLFRYISPKWNGLNIDTGVSFGGVADNDEKGTNYYFGGRYKNGNFEVGYNHAEVRLGSASAPTSQQTVNNRVDFLAAKYTLNDLTVNLGYVMTRNPSPGGVNVNFDPSVTGRNRVNANTWFTGAVYKFTPTLSWNMGYYSVTDLTPQKNNDVQMFATGLTYSPYKEWDFFIDYVKSRRKTGALGAFTIYDKWAPDTGITCSASSPSGCSESTKGQAGVSIGAQYKF